MRCWCRFIFNSESLLQLPIKLSVRTKFDKEGERLSFFRVGLTPNRLFIESPDKTQLHFLFFSTSISSFSWFHYINLYIRSIKISLMSLKLSSVFWLHSTSSILTPHRFSFVVSRGASFHFFCRLVPKISTGLFRGLMSNRPPMRWLCFIRIHEEETIKFTDRGEIMRNWDGWSWIKHEN